MSTTEVIAARRQHIRDNAPCVGCGATLATCKAERGKDPTAPEWFGCCARGLGMAPCQHTADAAALMALVTEIESGTVRTVEEVVADSQRRRAGNGMVWCDYLTQGQVWYPNGKPAVAIADMDPEWRYNSARFLEKRAGIVAAKYRSSLELWLAVAASSPLGPSDASTDSIERDLERENAEIGRDPVAWIRTTKLHRALVAGLPTKPKQVEKLAERARHWSTCPARTGDGDCRCEQIQQDNAGRAHLSECPVASGVTGADCRCGDTSPEWTI